MKAQAFLFYIVFSILISAQPVTFEMKTFEKVYNGKNGNKDSLFVFKITYPEFTGKDGFVISATKMNENVSNLTMGQKEGEGLMEQFNSMVSFISEEEDSAWFFGNWSFTTQITPVMISDEIMAFYFSHDEYMGGAHPNYFMGALNFLVKTGEEITFDQIFIPGAKDELNRLGEVIVRKEREIPANQTLTDYGYWFENDKFELNENFSISQDAITFTFNPYEVGPYALGPTDIKFPWSSIKHLVRKDGPLAKTAGK